MARPENVRIVRPDGTVIPCELAYGGLDAEGLEIWNVATELRKSDEVHIGLIYRGTKLCAPTRPDVTRAAVLDPGTDI